MNLITKLFSLNESIAGDFLIEYEFPWECLKDIGDYILRIAPFLSDDFSLVKEKVWIHKDAKVSPSSLIEGPTIICQGAEIRHCAYIRGNTIVGEKAVVGNSTEVKNSILFNEVQVPHFNYVGDSILGYKAHFGAGVITSNVKSDKKNVKVRLEDGSVVATDLRKFGALVGDFVEVGCNSVLNPGTIIGRNTNIYPLSCVRGYIKEDSICKRAGEVVKKV